MKSFLKIKPNSKKKIEKNDNEILKYLSLRKKNEIDKKRNIFF